MIGGKWSSARRALHCRRPTSNEAANSKGADKITLKANSDRVWRAECETRHHRSSRRAAGEARRRPEGCRSGAGSARLLAASPVVEQAQLSGGGWGRNGVGVVAARAPTWRLKLPAETRVQFTLNAALRYDPGSVR